MNVSNNEKKEAFTNADKYLQFSLGSEDYAIPLLMVKEVIPTPDTVPIPNSPDYYMGVMNLRGQIISIVDLRKKLKISPSTDNSEVAVMIVSHHDFNIGLVVDKIQKVLPIEPSEVSEVPDIQSKINSQYIQGVHQSMEDLTILVDLEKLLDFNKLRETASKAS